MIFDISFTSTGQDQTQINTTASDESQMPFLTRTGKPLPQTLIDQAPTAHEDRTSRREFLALASAFGASTATAYGLLGMTVPASAVASAKRGGNVRIQQDVRALKDPRLFDWPQMANITRGWLEYLVTYENDGTFRPALLKSWDISEDAKTYHLHLRKGVTWNNGDAFTAQDVARNIAGWCDRRIAGNSMAGRFAVLIDPETDMALTDAIEIVDDHTVILHLPRPDVTLIPSMSDYPAAIVHESFDADRMIANPIGTGPYVPESFEVGQKAVLTRNPDHIWWGAAQGAWVDRIEFLDLGTDPAAWAKVAAQGEIDMTYSVDGEYADVISAMEGWSKNELLSMATVVVRPNQSAEIAGRKPYANKRLRQAILKAVDNGVLLELGNAGRGAVAQNHHIGPAHPEYSDVGSPDHDPGAALAALKELRMENFEIEVHTIDDAWRKNTTDAVVAQLRDAGFSAKTTIVPGMVYWDNWNRFPFSTTDWNHRPLGVQIWALAYRSGEAWNEFGYSNPEFDAIVDAAVGTIDISKRRDLVAKGARLLQEDAVTIQPYWRALTNHTVSDLEGGAHHISFEIRPAELYWT
ncbi:peptide/nickel transport system substrate-binding protein [Shimia marina]|uniref:Nickel-binding periplasmic protein n=2 Tax=Shimia marina TaxID=321267 RepID=A0A0N7LRK9_9RHOB|nr:Nickel-binding periplasmic protein precursor [Shimia marina]SFD57897.1 peptide/nickel transport system substrate-binding protein [Shimia marina]